MGEYVLNVLILNVHYVLIHHTSVLNVLLDIEYLENNAFHVLILIVLFAHQDITAYNVFKDIKR